MYLFIYKLYACNKVVIHMQINTDTHMEILEGWNFFKKFQCFSPAHHRIVWGMWGTHHVTWRWRLWLPWSECRGNGTTLTPDRGPAALAVKAVVCRAPTPGSLDGSLTYPDAVHNGCGFALGRLWVADEVIPSAEHPPAECIVFTGSTGEARARVLSHPAREDQRKRNSKETHAPNVHCSTTHNSQHVEAT